MTDTERLTEVLRIHHEALAVLLRGAVTTYPDAAGDRHTHEVFPKTHAAKDAIRLHRHMLRARSLLHPQVEVTP